MSLKNNVRDRLGLENDKVQAEIDAFNAALRGVTEPFKGNRLKVARQAGRVYDFSRAQGNANLGALVDLHKMAFPEVYEQGLTWADLIEAAASGEEPDFSKTGVKDELRIVFDSIVATMNGDDKVKDFSASKNLFVSVTDASGAAEVLSWDEFFAFAQERVSKEKAGFTDTRNRPWRNHDQALSFTKMHNDLVVAIYGGAGYSDCSEEQFEYEEFVDGIDALRVTRFAVAAAEVKRQEGLKSQSDAADAAKTARALQHVIREKQTAANKAVRRGSTVGLVTSVPALLALKMIADDDGNYKLPN